MQAARRTQAWGAIAWFHADARRPHRPLHRRPSSAIQMLAGLGHHSRPYYGTPLFIGHDMVSSAIQPMVSSAMSHHMSHIVSSAIQTPSPTPSHTPSPLQPPLSTATVAHTVAPHQPYGHTRAWAPPRYRSARAGPAGHTSRCGWAYGWAGPGCTHPMDGPGTGPAARTQRHGRMQGHTAAMEMPMGAARGRMQGHTAAACRGGRHTAPPHAAPPARRHGAAAAPPPTPY
jgi:hypothetical protein